MRAGNVLKLLLTLGAVVAVVLVAVVKSIDVDAYRRLMIAAVAAETGRILSIAELRLELSPRPRLVATDVALANAEGGSRARMLRVARIEADIAPLALLRRRIDIRRLVLIEPDLLLERGNWRFAPVAEDAPIPPVATPATSLALDRVTIRQGRVRFGDVAAAIPSLTVTADSRTAPLGIVGQIEVASHRVDVSGMLGSLADFVASDQPFPVRLEAATGGAMVAVIDGAVPRTAAGEGLDLRLVVEGVDAAAALRPVAAALPPLGPFRVAARVTGSLAAPALVDIDAGLGKKDVVRLTAKGSVARPLVGQGVALAWTAEATDAAAAGRAFGLALPVAGPLAASGRWSTEADHLRFEAVRATIGGSDFAGTVGIRLDGRRPVLDVELRSARFDLADLGVGKGASARDAGPLFGERPLALDWLRHLDVGMSWHAETLLSHGVPLRQAWLRLVLDDGLLRVDPFAVRLSAGEAQMRLALQADGAAVEAGAAVTVDDVDAGEFLAALGMPQLLSGGDGRVRIEVSGSGGSPHAILAALRGEVAVSIEAGRGDARLAETGMALLRDVAPWSPQENASRLECFVGRFAIRDGVASSRVLLLDTAHAVVEGDAAIDFGAETIGARLVPQGKQVAAPAAAVEITGSLTAPVVRPASALSMVMPAPRAEGAESACAVAVRQVKRPLVELPQSSAVPASDDIGGTR